MKLYKHFKGGIYKHLYTATYSENLEEMIIYQSLKDGKIWVRPSKRFFEEVSPGVKRFIELEDVNIHCHPRLEFEINLPIHFVIVDEEYKDLFVSYRPCKSKYGHIIVKRTEYESLVRHL